MKKLLSMLLAACMALSCAVGVAAEDSSETETTTTTYSATRMEIDQNSGDGYWNLQTYWVNQHFVYDLAELSGKTIVSAKFCFTPSSAVSGATVSLYEDLTPYTEWKLTAGSSLYYISSTLSKGDVFASKYVSASAGTEIDIDISDFVESKVTGGNTTIQFGVKSDASASVGHRSGTKPTLIVEYSDAPPVPGTETATVSFSKRATNDDNAGYVYNYLSCDPCKQYLGYDLSAYADKAILSAKFNFLCQSGTSAYLQKITSSYDSWTNWITKDNPPTTGDKIADISTSSTGVTYDVDITSFVQNELAAGNSKIHFAVGSSASFMFGNKSSGTQPTLVIEYVDAPKVNITEPTKTKFDEGEAVTFSATVTNNVGGTVTATVDDEEVTLTEDNGTYSYTAEGLANGEHTFVITATSAADVVISKSITVNVGYVATTTTLNRVMSTHNVPSTSDQYGNATYNVAVWGQEKQYWYFAYDLNDFKDTELKDAYFTFAMMNAASTSIRLYEMKTDDLSWTSASLPAISDNYFAELAVSEKRGNDNRYKIDITDFVEDKLAKGERYIQIAVTSADASVMLGSNDKKIYPQMEVTSTTQLRPTITANADYSFVMPGSNEFAFTVDGNDEEVTSVTAALDDAAAEELTLTDGVYSLTKDIAEGTHTLTITATNRNGVKKNLVINMIAKRYEVTDNAITIADGTATATATLKAYAADVTNATVIIAVYNSYNKMVAVNLNEYNSLSADGTPLSVSVAVPTEGATVKMFVWDGIGSMAPFCSATETAVAATN